MKGSAEVLQSYVCYAEDGLGEIAVKLLETYPDKKVMLFYGEMGVGKTTFVKALCRQLGVVDATGSPTFSIANEYQTLGGETVYHFDFYRLKNENEALDIGLEEYLDSGCYCFIEWPDKIKSFLPPYALSIRMEIQNENRLFSIGAPE